MHQEILDYYKGLGISEQTLSFLQKELRVPQARLTALARPRRLDAVREALTWGKGPSQEERKTTALYVFGEYSVAVAKPGKEAHPDYKGCRHYITGEKTNNPNDMLPHILKSGEKFGDNLTFTDVFEKIEKLIRADLFGLELIGSLLFRAAFMLDVNSCDGNWRYTLSDNVAKILEKRIPDVSGIPVRVFLHFLEVLSLNEDVKMYTLGYDDFKKDYGRINTLLTFVHLIAVFLGRRSISKFAGSLARPPSGVAPIPKTKAKEYFPLLSPEELPNGITFDF